MITRETKERFVKMLKNRQVIVVRCKKSARKTYNYKFIGANELGRWDFTPLVAEISGAQSDGNDILLLSIRGIDAAAIITDTLIELKNQGVSGISSEKYELYVQVRSRLCTFYM